ncbi:PBSX family phage terminase large subunit [Aneurinibacillus aneurinilyticus]|uniref:PBSX family phage terminase large subunit n=1 Tax=Aneurinibacillus aneurinilyticus TaxID=1391 RepID=UPI00352656F3
MKVKMSDIIVPHFKKFWVVSRKKEHLRYVLKGGRGSGKSFHIPLRIVSDIIEYPVSALVMRKVQNTVQKSVFQQIKAATMVMGVSHLFKFTPSKLEITYIPRGNKLYFAGADDPEKLKSIKDAEFPVAILWIEELAEFKTEDEVTTIENSVLREELEGKIVSEAENRKKKYGFDYSFYYSYNPPKRKQSWVNKKYESAFVDKNTFVDHSTYLDNPHLSKKFVEEAENVKKKKPLKYQWEYEGKAIGSGIVPFANLTFRTITDTEMRVFDNIRQGIDWGYGPDPLAFVRVHYDKTRRRLFFMDEHYGSKISNRKLAEWMKGKGYHSMTSTADSAEPKSIDEMREFGVRIVGAKKGPGSVEFGEKWLDDLEEIIIDPARTPHAAKEFEDIDYQTDADGNPKARLDENNNHAIDATRYACEDLMGKRGASSFERIF